VTALTPGTVAWFNHFTAENTKEMRAIKPLSFNYLAKSYVIDIPNTPNLREEFEKTVRKQYDKANRFSSEIGGFDGAAFNSSLLKQDPTFGLFAGAQGTSAPGSGTSVYRSSDNVNQALKRNQTLWDQIVSFGSDTGKRAITTLAWIGDQISRLEYSNNAMHNVYVQRAKQAGSAGGSDITLGEHLAAWTLPWINTVTPAWVFDDEVRNAKFDGLFLRSKISGQELLESEYENFAEMSGFAKGSLGFFVDVAQDPLTYITIGYGSVAKVIGAGAARAVGKKAVSDALFKRTFFSAEGRAAGRSAAVGALRSSAISKGGKKIAKGAKSSIKKDPTRKAIFEEASNDAFDQLKAKIAVDISDDLKGLRLAAKSISQKHALKAWNAYAAGVHGGDLAGAAKAIDKLYLSSLEDAKSMIKSRNPILFDFHARNAGKSFRYGNQGAAFKIADDFDTFLDEFARVVMPKLDLTERTMRDLRLRRGKLMQMDAEAKNFINNFNKLLKDHVAGFSPDGRPPSPEFDALLQSGSAPYVNPVGVTPDWAKPKTAATKAKEAKEAADKEALNRVADAPEVPEAPITKTNDDVVDERLAELMAEQEINDNAVKQGLAQLHEENMLPTHQVLGNSPTTAAVAKSLEETFRQRLDEVVDAYKTKAADHAQHDKGQKKAPVVYSREDNARLAEAIYNAYIEAAHRLRAEQHANNPIVMADTLKSHAAEVINTLTADAKHQVLSDLSMRFGKSLPEAIPFKGEFTDPDFFRNINAHNGGKTAEDSFNTLVRFWLERGTSSNHTNQRSSSLIPNPEALQKPGFTADDVFGVPKTTDPREVISLLNTANAPEKFVLAVKTLFNAKAKMRKIADTNEELGGISGMRVNNHTMLDYFLHEDTKLEFRNEFGKAVGNMSVFGFNEVNQPSKAVLLAVEVFKDFQAKYPTSPLGNTIKHMLLGDDLQNLQGVDGLLSFRKALDSLGTHAALTRQAVRGDFQGRIPDAGWRVSMFNQIWGNKAIHEKLTNAIHIGILSEVLKPGHRFSATKIAELINDYTSNPAIADMLYKAAKLEERAAEVKTVRRAQDAQQAAQEAEAVRQAGRDAPPIAIQHENATFDTVTIKGKQVRHKRTPVVIDGRTVGYVEETGRKNGAVVFHDLRDNQRYPVKSNRGPGASGNKPGERIVNDAAVGEVQRADNAHKGLQKQIEDLLGTPRKVGDTATPANKVRELIKNVYDEYGDAEQVRRAAREDTEYRAQEFKEAEEIGAPAAAEHQAQLDEGAQRVAASQQASKEARQAKRAAASDKEMRAAAYEEGVQPAPVESVEQVIADSTPNRPYDKDTVKAVQDLSDKLDTPETRAFIAGRLASAAENLTADLFFYQEKMADELNKFRLGMGASLKVAGIPVAPLPYFTNPFQTYAGLTVLNEQRGRVRNWVTKVLAERPNISNTMAKFRRPSSNLDSMLNELRKTSANNGYGALLAIHTEIDETWKPIRNQSYRSQVTEAFFSKGAELPKELEETENRLRDIAAWLSLNTDGDPQIILSRVRALNSLMPKRFRLPDAAFSNKANNDIAYTREWLIEVSRGLARDNITRNAFAGKALKDLDLPKFEYALQHAKAKLQAREDTVNSMLANFSVAAEYGEGGRQRRAFIAQMNKSILDENMHYVQVTDEIIPRTHIPTHMRNYDYYVRADYAVEMKKMMAYMSDSYVADAKLLNMGFWSSVLNYWKGMVTTFNIPKFHVANAMSDTFLASLDGVTNPKMYHKGFTVIRNSHEASKKISANPELYTGIMEEAIDTPFPSRAMRVGQRQDNMPNIPVREEGGPAPLISTISTRDNLTVHVDSDMYMNAYVARGVGQTQVTNILYKGVPASRDTAAMDMVMGVFDKVNDWSNMREDGFRMSHFIHAVEDEARKGSLTLDEIFDKAAERVIRYHFDYSDVSDIEKHLVGKYIPFYKWSRNIVPLTLNLFFTNPKAFTIPQAFNENMSQVLMPQQRDQYGNEIPFDAVVPDYIASSGWLPVSSYTDANGNKMARYAALNLPLTQTINQWIAPLVDPFLDDELQTTTQVRNSAIGLVRAGLGAANPYIKIVSGTAYGTTFGPGGAEFRSENVVMDTLKQLIPGTAAATSINRARERGVNPWDMTSILRDRIGFLTGGDNTEGGQMWQLSDDMDRLVNAREGAGNQWEQASYGPAGAPVGSDVQEVFLKQRGLK